jgi:hypothetical protein
MVENEDAGPRAMNVIAYRAAPATGCMVCGNR